MASIIRIAEPQDAAAILAIYAPYCESTPVSFEIVAPSVQEMSERIGRVLETYPWLVCEMDGELAGYVYASQHRLRAAFRWSVDVAVYVAAGRQRQGIGRALYSGLLMLLRMQNFVRAYSGIVLPNPGSVGLHEAMGFTPISVYPAAGFKLGRWLDMGWWECPLNPPAADPAEPIPFAVIRNSDQVVSCLAERERLLRLAE